MEGQNIKNYVNGYNFSYTFEHLKKFLYQCKIVIMGMKTLRVYIENSVIGGYFDEEFKVPTQKLFDLLKNGTYIPVISSHVLAELNQGAPDYVKKNLEYWNMKKMMYLMK